VHHADRNPQRRGGGESALEAECPNVVFDEGESMLDRTRNIPESAAIEERVRRDVDDSADQRGRIRQTTHEAVPHVLGRGPGGSIAVVIAKVVGRADR
jgi:hypothetical protein